MRQKDIWNCEGAQGYDTPGTGMFAPEVLGPTVDRLAELASDGRALEFAIGTGRVPVIAGDMATTRAPGVYALVYLVYNTNRVHRRVPVPRLGLPARHGVLALAFHVGAD
jgi:hypothetical protein